jgi:hypothetical protein
MPAAAAASRPERRFQDVIEAAICVFHKKG